MLSHQIRCSENFDINKIIGMRCLVQFRLHKNGETKESGRLKKHIDIIRYPSDMMMRPMEAHIRLNQCKSSRIFIFRSVSHQLHNVLM